MFTKFVPRNCDIDVDPVTSGPFRDRTQISVTAGNGTLVLLLDNSQARLLRTLLNNHLGDQ